MALCYGGQKFEAIYVTLCASCSQKEISVKLWIIETWYGNESSERPFFQLQENFSRGREFHDQNCVLLSSEFWQIIDKRILWLVMEKIWRFYSRSFILRHRSYSFRRNNRIILCIYISLSDITCPYYPPVSKSMHWRHNHLGLLGVSFQSVFFSNIFIFWKCDLGGEFSSVGAWAETELLAW